MTTIWECRTLTTCAPAPRVSQEPLLATTPAGRTLSPALSTGTTQCPQLDWTSTSRDIEKVHRRLADLFEEENDEYPPTGLAKSVRQLPEWIQLGCGDAEYNCAEKKATFLGGKMPDTLPDITSHNSFFSEAMKADPSLYDRLKSKKTSSGVTLGHCIKTGIDNPGHPHIKAGDIPNK